MARTKDSPQSREVRQRLLSAAGEVFAEHGYRATTIREITERAGANLAAVNYHFHDKAGLYASALKTVIANAEQVPIPAPDGPPRARLRAILGSMLTYLLDPDRPSWQNRLMARELAEPTPALDQVIEADLRPRCLAIRHILRDMAGGELPTEKLTLLVNSVIGQCVHYSQFGALIQRLSPELADYPRRIDLLAEHITAFTVPAVREAGRAARRQAHTP